MFTSFFNMVKLITKEQAYELHSKKGCNAWAIARVSNSIYLFVKSEWICTNCGWSNNEKFHRSSKII